MLSVVLKPENTHRTTNVTFRCRYGRRHARHSRHSDDQRRQTLLFLSGRSEDDGDVRYAPEKWRVKEVLGHINDTERIMSYRALRIARGDATPIEGYEQDDYVRNGPFVQRQLADLIEEYIPVRRATISSISEFGRSRLDPPRHSQQKRSERASAGLHYRRARTAPSADNGREVFEIVSLSFSVVVAAAHRVRSQNEQPSCETPASVGRFKKGVSTSASRGVILM